jgi:hypothetical protein
MALINLKTNLKSLKYGNDRPGGGSSGQPYIVTPIPDDLTYNGPDFLLRQGALQASLTDSERILKWFSDPLSVRGLLFTTKQIALERQNPAIPGGLNRIYLPTSTISQVGLNALGFHLNKQGLDPYELGYAQGGTKGYFNYTLNKDTQDNVSRLSLLYSTKIADAPASSLRTAQEKEFNISGKSEYSLSYSGGPDSVGGLGRTNIKLAGNDPYSLRDRTSTYKLDSQTLPNPSNVYAFDNNLLVRQAPFVESKSTSLRGLTDYRVTINNNNGLKKSILPQTDYGQFNREDSYKTSKTYYRILSPATLLDPNNSASIDGVNASSPRTAQQAVDEGLFESDLIKFFFEVINPKDSNNSSEFLFFRAYINDMADGFKADWQPYKYVGRAENFYKYTGFSRDISLSFTIYAHSRGEMKPIYEKLNKLVGVTAPTYGGNGYMLGNFIKLTVGTYFNSVPGIINNINLKPSFDTGWDINRTADGSPIKPRENNNLGQIPRMIEVDLTFTPIHSFTPESNSTQFINNDPPPLPSPTPPPSSNNESIDEPIQQPFELYTNNFVNLGTSPSEAPIVTGDLSSGAIEVG